MLVDLASDSNQSNRDFVISLNMDKGHIFLLFRQKISLSTTVSRKLLTDVSLTGHYCYSVKWASNQMSNVKCVRSIHMLYSFLIMQKLALT